MGPENVDYLLSGLKYAGLTLGLAFGLLGILTRTHAQKTKKLTVWGWCTLAIIILSPVLTGSVQYMEDRRQKSQAILAQANATTLREEIKRLQRNELDNRESLQVLRSQLDVASRKNSERITSEKIRVLKPEISGWVTNLLDGKSSFRAEYQQRAKAAEENRAKLENEALKREIRMTGLAYPILSFATRFLEEAAQDLAKQTGQKLELPRLQFPENLYEKTISEDIHIGSNMVWKLQVCAPKSAEVNSPFLVVQFIDSQGKSSGTLEVRTAIYKNEFWMSYESPIAMPDPATIRGNRSLGDYETPIRDVFQQVLGGQILH